MDDAPAPAFHMRIPTDLEMVRPVRRILEGLLASLGWNEEDSEDAGLVVTEVLQNAVEHGSRGDGGEAVEVRCAVDGPELVVEVADPGTGQGPDALLRQDVTVAPPPDAPRGRGLYLVHRMSRRMERARAGEGSCVRVRLRASGGE
jgi:anti-sigma regulatory factor (Ser/Thr protein kinase)